MKMKMSCLVFLALASCRQEELRIPEIETGRISEPREEEASESPDVPAIEQNPKRAEAPIEEGKPKAEPEAPRVSNAQQVLAFLATIRGRQTLTGQHNKEPNADPSRWTNRIKATTGNFPALWSGDFLFGADDVKNRQMMIDEAKRQWQSGALINLMWHACPPTRGESCAWDNGVWSKLSDAEWADLIQDNGRLNKIWKSRLDSIAVFLLDLKNAGVAPMFRPFHEVNQGGFWWAGRKGPQGTAKLYELTHDYLVKTKGLSNLIWVWDVQDIPEGGKSWEEIWNAYKPRDDLWISWPSISMINRVTLGISMKLC